MNCLLYYLHAICLFILILDNQLVPSSIQNQQISNQMPLIVIEISLNPPVIFIIQVSSIPCQTILLYAAINVNSFRANKSCSLLLFLIYRKTSKRSLSVKYAERSKVFGTYRIIIGLSVPRCLLEVIIPKIFAVWYKS